MARRRTFIGIGEALLAEYPDRAEPAGLALEVARAAAALEHRGVAVSRLGQDIFANELLTQLESEAAKLPGINRAHLQSDPDLPTGRLIVRSFAGAHKETLDHRAAFDNLQWDFDLVDVAKEADAVVFGMLAQRCAQSSSVIVRFLSEATGALIACDLTNRSDETFERALALRSLEQAQIAVVDSTAWSILKLGRNDVPHDEAARTILREVAGLAAVVWLDPNAPMEMYGRDGSAAAPQAVERRWHTAAIVALLHAMLSGTGTSQAVEFACRAAEFMRDHPEQTIPESLGK